MDLHQHLDYIHGQCKSRLFSPNEEEEVMGLCVYAFVDEFPHSNNELYSHRLPFKNHVLTSVVSAETSIH